jgi:hypothetical protein
MYVFCAPTRGVLKLNTKLRVRLFPTPDTDEAAKSNVHRRFDTVPDPSGTAVMKPTPLSLTIWKLLLLGK